MTKSRINKKRKGKALAFRQKESHKFNPKVRQKKLEEVLADIEARKSTLTKSFEQSHELSKNIKNFIGSMFGKKGS